MVIRGVLFDKDGTLIESNATWVPIYKTFLAEAFKAGPSEVNALMAMAGYDVASDRFVPGGILAAGTTKQAMEIWWPDLDAAGIQEKCALLDHDYAPLATDMMKPLMPLIPIFDELHLLGLELGIATNDSFRSATNHMHRLGVHDYFVDVIAADNVAIPKPSGQMIARFAETTGLHPSEIAMVGDNTHDMEEAHNGGAGLAIAVLSGNARREDIAHLAHYVLDSVADLPALFKGLK